MPPFRWRHAFRGGGYVGQGGWRRSQGYRDPRFRAFCLLWLSLFRARVLLSRRLPPIRGKAGVCGVRWCCVCGVGEGGCCVLGRICSLILCYFVIAIRVSRPEICLFLALPQPDTRHPECEMRPVHHCYTLLLPLLLCPTYTLHTTHTQPLRHTTHHTSPSPSTAATAHGPRPRQHHDPTHTGRTPPTVLYCFHRRLSVVRVVCLCV